MTVSECLKEWLRDYENLDISDLLTDFIDAPKAVWHFSRVHPKRKELSSMAARISQNIIIFCKKFYAVG